MRARTIGLAAVGIAAALLACQARAPRTPTQVTFRFAPPDGTTLVQEVTTLRDSGLEAHLRRHDRTVTRSSIEFHTRPEGYTITATLLSFETMRDGVVRADPAREALRGVPITYRVRADGTLEGIDGLAGLAEQDESLREDELVAQETDEWNERVASLAGRTVSIGESIDGEAPYTRPNGEPILVSTRTTFTRFETCGRARCVRVDQRFHSDPAALTSSAAPAPPTGPGVAGSLRRLIDPETMLLHAEELSRNIAMELADEKGAVRPITIRETRRYRFEYR